MPSDSTIVAPCAGRLIVAPDSDHAYGIATPDGVEVLIHVGIDTVNLQDKGFTTHVKLNQEVKAGDPLVDVDLDAVQGRWLLVGNADADHQSPQLRRCRAHHAESSPGWRPAADRAPGAEAAAQV